MTVHVLLPYFGPCHVLQRPQFILIEVGKFRCTEPSADTVPVLVHPLQIVDGILVRVHWLHVQSRQRLNLEPDCHHRPATFDWCVCIAAFSLLIQFFLRAFKDALVEISVLSVQVFFVTIEDCLQLIEVYVPRFAEPIVLDVREHDV